LNNKKEAEMENAKRQNMLAFIIRWLARLVCIGFVVLFIVFFIGEGGLSNPAGLGTTELLLLACIPLLFVIGTVVAFFSEALGGIIIILSVIGFNAVDIAGGSAFTGSFWYLLIPGVVFVLLARLAGNKRAVA
jgi:hypothetical protein